MIAGEVCKGPTISYIWWQAMAPSYAFPNVARPRPRPWATATPSYASPSALPEAEGRMQLHGCPSSHYHDGHDLWCGFHATQTSWSRTSTSDTSIKPTGSSLPLAPGLSTGWCSMLQKTAPAPSWLNEHILFLIHPDLLSRGAAHISQQLRSTPSAPPSAPVC